MTHRFLPIFVLVSLLAMLLPATAAAQSSTYHPNPAARDFSEGAAGWTASSSSGGPCSVSLLCPSLSNSYRSSGGAGGAGDGHLRVQLGGPLGVGGEVTSIWSGPSFRYDGAAGLKPDRLELNLDRRADVESFLAPTGNEADFAVQLVDPSGAAIELVPPSTLAGAPDWAAIPTASVDPGQVEIGRRYHLRIVSRFQFGSDVAPGSTADYDNVELVAERDPRDPAARCEQQLFGTNAADDLTGTSGGDRVKSRGGADTVRARGGADCVFGATGEDTLLGQAGPDELHGNGGADTIRGGFGGDLLLGGGGADPVFGEAGNDTLKGAAGSDVLRGGAGSDLLKGNQGDDELFGGAGPDRGLGGIGADKLVGGSGNDTLKGNGSADSLAGGGGHDKLTGGAGPDLISGGAGPDVINARGLGRDRIHCGAGRDLVRADRRDRVSGDCERVRRKKA